MYNSKGLYDNALPYLLEAYKLKPNSYEINNNLGSAYLNKGLYEDSIKYYVNAISIQGQENSEARYNLGLVYLESGLYNDAKRTFSELIQLKPEYWSAYYQLGLLLIKEDDKVNAKIILETLLSKNPNYSKKSEVESLLQMMNE